MTQNLIINNDENDDVVKFTVEIPDGFNSFKIDSINGTLINQDYLCVGDRLNFSFSNNPIMYNTKGSKGADDWRYSTTLKMIDTKNMNEIKKEMDPEFFKFIALDLFNVYRVKFIPVYSYFDYQTKKFLYLFNPTKTDELRDDPTIDIENYKLAKYTFVNEEEEEEEAYIEAPFAGSFIIALQKVPKIDDIAVTFGESISNSKTQFEDMGAINAAGEAVQENYASTAYTYGSAWRYNVSNLIMNHRIMVNSNSGKLTTELLYFVNYQNEEVTTPYASFNYSLVNGNTKVEGETVKFYTEPDTQLNNEISLLWMESNALPFLKVDQSKLTHVPYDPHITFPNSKLIGNGCKIKGSDLTGYKIYKLDRDGNEQIDECARNFDIKPDAYYSGNVLRLRVYKGATTLLKNVTCRFRDVSADGYAVVPIGWHSYVLAYIDDDPVPKSIKFKFANDNVGINRVILGRTFTVDGNGELSFVYSINTGFIPSNTYSISTIQGYTKQPLQLTEIDQQHGTVNAAEDDILITHIKDENGTPGLKLSTPTLTNNIYNVEYDNNGNPSVQISPPDLGEDNNGQPVRLPADLFLPMKSRQAIAKWSSGFGSAFDVTSGICILMNQDNRPCQELNDHDSVYYLADGHETLNVEPPKEDDEKYKTFNGTVMFDRSSARITRVLANSQANSCIGYINDILAAKLARYYFVADYNIFDSYISTTLRTQFANSKDQMFNVYNNFSNGRSFNTGEHSALLCSCFDLVKLIGSDTVVNNCMPSLNPEQQTVKCQPLTNEEITQENVNKVINKSEPFKFFHYYNSGFNNYPYFGIGSNDRENGTSSIGGLSTYRLPDDLFISGDIAQQYAPNASIKLNHFKINTARAKEYYEQLGAEEIKNNLSKSWMYPTNIEVDSGFISCVPIARVYRNANFEQSDLSISTGRMKTLSPIYIQAANRSTIQNLIYMFDMMFHIIVSRFLKVSNTANSFNYFGCLFNVPDDPHAGDLPLGSSGVLRRFTPSYFTPQLEEQQSNYNVAFSLDSVLMLNYLSRQSVNDYDDVNDLINSLPKENNINTSNEELIGDLKTNTFYTNVQLFSSRYFNFYENITPLSFVNYVQVLTQSTDFPISTLELYFGTTNKQTEGDEDEGRKETIDQINEYRGTFSENLSIRHIYNLQRTVKTLISKLGEFLEYPKIIFGTTLDFNNSNTVNIQTLSATQYRSPFAVNYNYRIDPITEQQVVEQTETFNNNSQTLKQKQNISMFGVVFRYHQLSLGWAKMDTDIAEQYTIGKDKGPKHFTLMLYDEYGREFPNEDTSQGFKNNLKLELSLFNG